jgi:hypothetical protein
LRDWSVEGTCGVLTKNDDALVLLLVLSALVVVVTLPMLIKGLRGSLTIFEPITVLTVGFLLYFVVGPVVSLLTEQTAYLGRDFRSLYPLGFIGVAASAAVMWLGYALPLGPRIGKWVAIRLSLRGTPAVAHQEALMRHAGWAVVAGGALGLFSSLLLGGSSVGTVLLPGVLSSGKQSLEASSATTPNYLYLMLEWFIPGYLLLLAGGALRRRWLGLVLAASVLIVYVSVGFRYRIVIFLVGIATVRYARKAVARPLLVLLIGGVAGLLFIGYVGAARNYYRSGGTAGSPVPGTSDVLDSSRGDTVIFETFAAVLEAVPQRVSYAGLAPIRGVFVQPIPRQIWPDKPGPVYLNKINEAIGTPAAFGSGPAVPNFGEYYLAFGWPGVVLGMLLFGAAARALWEFWRASKGDGFALVVFACSLPFLLQVVTRGYTAAIVQEWFFIVFPAVFVARRARRRSRARAKQGSRVIGVVATGNLAQQPAGSGDA